MERTTRRLLLAISVVIAALSTAQAEESRTSSDNPQRGLLEFKGTPEEQAACSHDATTFCREQIPDTLRVLSCLQQNRSRLRKACRQVLEAHGE
ncbi:MAG: hypothetical protein IRY89_06765 [Pseudolabrys sp.]|nr:hypothetical protein [Pseudolabrys sp.]